jgi:hypothetical protein
MRHLHEEAAMLRDSHQPWWRRMFQAEPVPVLIQQSNPSRRCPDCSAVYEIGARYCAGCQSATPEWRFG